MWRSPVGLGANRTRTLMRAGILREKPPIAKPNHVLDRPENHAFRRSATRRFRVGNGRNATAAADIVESARDCHEHPAPEAQRYSSLNRTPQIDGSSVFND